MTDATKAMIAEIAVLLESATDRQHKAFIVECMKGHQGVKNYGCAADAGYLAANYAARMKVAERHREIMESSPKVEGESRLDRWLRIWMQVFPEVFDVAEEVERARQLARLREIVG